MVRLPRVTEPTEDHLSNFNSAGLVISCANSTSQLFHQFVSVGQVQNLLNNPPVQGQIRLGHLPFARIIKNVRVFSKPTCFFAA